MSSRRSREKTAPSAPPDPKPKGSGEPERNDKEQSAGQESSKKNSLADNKQGARNSLADAIEVVVAKLGLIGIIATALIGVVSTGLVAYLGYLQTQIPIQATQTAEARLTQAVWLMATATLAQTITPTPTLTLTPTATFNPSPCPENMVLIPDGYFKLGAVPGDAEAEPDEMQQTKIFLDAFCMDKTEVSNEAYFQALGQPAPAPSLALLPVVNVTWIEANQYCADHGWALPTEAQWEKAARGEHESLYPWGNDIQGLSDRANYGETLPRRLRPVNDYAAGASPHGILNLAGNAAEWVADWYAEDWYARMPDQNPFKSVMPSALYPTRVVRGGSFVDILSNLRISNRDGTSLPDDQFDYLGFRCAATPSVP